MEIQYPHKCLECGFETDCKRSLGNHLAKSKIHKQIGNSSSMENYVLKNFLNGENPICSCGCGGNVIWKNNLCKFNQFINGHNKTGFDISLYRKTPEQQEKTNIAVRKFFIERAKLK